MIPRRALVAGGLVAAAGGAVYLYQDPAPPQVEVADAPRIEWVAGAESSGQAPSAGGLAIRDPLRVVTPEPSTSALRSTASAAVDLETLDELESSLRPAVTAAPDLPETFASPASPNFAGVDEAPKLSVNVGAMEDPRRPRMVAASARVPGSLGLDPATVASATVASAKPPVARDAAIGRHLIEDGDTLEAIARRHYGDASLAGFLFERNRRILKYPDLLPVGKEIVLYEPPAKEDASPTATTGEPLPALVPIE